MAAVTRSRSRNRDAERKAVQADEGVQLVPMKGMQKVSRDAWPFPGGIRHGVAHASRTDYECVERRYWIGGRGEVFCVNCYPPPPRFKHLVREAQSCALQVAA